MFTAKKQATLVYIKKKTQAIDWNLACDDSKHFVNSVSKNLLIKKKYSVIISLGIR